jgi:hypothetical protein
MKQARIVRNAAGTLPNWLPRIEVPTDYPSQEIEKSFQPLEMEL